MASILLLIAAVGEIHGFVGPDGSSIVASLPLPVGR
jgi:hypothetical protein